MNAEKKPAGGSRPPPSSARRLFSYHLTAFVFHGSHFFPYSVFAYPLIAAGRAAAGRLPPAWRYLVWTAYFACAALYAINSYFFNYTFAWAANPGYLILSATVALLIFAAAAFGRPHLGWLLFLALLIVNLAGGGHYPFAWRITSGLFAHIAILIIFIVAVIKTLGLRSGRLPLAIACGLFFYTDNSPFPLVIILAAGAAVLESIRTNNFRSFNPAVQAVSAFNILLIVGFAQFYSTSLPRALDAAAPPACVTPVPVYGSARLRFPELAMIDNRFLSYDPLGRYLFFGARMSEPDLFRLDRRRLSSFSSLTVKGVADNAVFDPAGRWLIVGSVSGNTLEKIEIDPFRVIRTASLPYRPIRLRIDPARRKVYAISEFEGSQLYAYDTETLAPKFEIPRAPRDRNTRDFVVDPAAGRIAVSQWLDLVLYDSRTRKPLDRVRTANRGLGRMAIDTERRIIYLTHTRRGVLLGFSYKGDKLRQVCAVPLGAGIRDIAFDPTRNSAAVANYFSGALTGYTIS